MKTVDENPQCDLIGDTKRNTMNEKPIRYPRLETKKISDLCTHPNGVRTIEAEAFFWVKKQHEQFGMLRPPTFNVTTGRLIGGAQCVKALREIGAEEIPVWCVEVPADLEEAAGMLLNNCAGEWNWQGVSDHLKAMKRNGVELGLTGFPLAISLALCSVEEWNPPEPQSIDGQDAKQVTMFE